MAFTFTDILTIAKKVCRVKKREGRGPRVLRASGVSILFCFNPEFVSFSTLTHAPENNRKPHYQKPDFA